jgi:hypothetical protein
MDVNTQKSIVTIMMNAQKILVTLIAMNTILANMNKLCVTITMSVLMTHVALLKDVFTLITHTDVSPKICVMMPNAIKIQDVLSLIPLTVVMMMTNVMNMIVMKM